MLRARIFKWLEAGGMINGEIEKLFFVNPKGALREFSRLQYNAFSGEIGSNYDWVVAVDGAVSKSQATKGKAGIGGVIRNKECRLIYVFSGPSIANQVFEVEMDACMYVMSRLVGKFVDGRRVVVCVDSAELYNFLSRLKYGGREQDWIT